MERKQLKDEFTDLLINDAEMRYRLKFLLDITELEFEVDRVKEELYEYFDS